jgi:hypothetical protein
VDHASLLARYDAEQASRRAAEQQRDDALARATVAEQAAAGVEASAHGLEANCALSLAQVEALAERLSKADATAADAERR